MKDFILGGWAVLIGLPFCHGVQISMPTWLGLLTSFSLMAYAYYKLFKDNSLN